MSQAKFLTSQSLREVQETMRDELSKHPRWPQELSIQQVLVSLVFQRRYPGVETEVARIENCDCCGTASAEFDCRMKHGFWGFLCASCFDKEGVGLGMGYGQHLVRYDPSDVLSAEYWMQYNLQEKAAT
jgi:hypothetical protein